MKPARILTALAIVGASSMSGGDSDAATITASYAIGHPDVTINGYGTSAMGTFRLDDGGVERLALCIEAHEGHSTAAEAYHPVENQVDSPELDALLWLMERDTEVDADLAVAAAALAWFHAGARRTIGVPVWADGARGFAPVTPTSPEPWGELGPLTLAHPIGLRSGGVDLDRAERAVAALDRRVAAMRGPWQLSADGGRFHLTGPGGSIPGQPVTITVTWPSGTETTTSHTDASGWVDPAVGDPVDGAEVTAIAEAPGRHQEWDGDGAIQRMTTATTEVVEASFEVPPLPRHVQVVKRSTDATIGVAGGEFVLVDSVGVEMGSATSDVDGIARFGPLDPVQHPAPFVVHERTAPPGLDRTAPDVQLPQLSADPDQPTVVEMTDTPLISVLRVRKQLSDDDAGPSDRSGFVFSIRRRADSWADEAVTGPDGVTEPIRLPIGVYDVCERSTPTWANLLVDEGCVEVDVDVTTIDSAEPVEIIYRNAVPTPIIETLATTADGGSEVAASGGVVVDNVALGGLVPGTTYTVTGEIVDRASGGSTGITASETFVAEEPEATMRLEFAVPALPAGAIVVTERLMIGDRVVAEHVDLTDADQTLMVVQPATVTSSPTTTVEEPTTTLTTTTTTTTTTPTPTPTPTTTTTTTTTTPVAEGPPTSGTRTPPATLPRTGGPDVAILLRVGDIGFVLGVSAIAIVGLLPRRDDPDRAGGEQPA